MKNLTTEIAVIKNEMKNLTNKIDDGFRMNSEEHQEMVTLFKEGLEKKAGKWVEKAFVSIITVVGLSVLGAILALIIK